MKGKPVLSVPRIVMQKANHIKTKSVQPLPEPQYIGDYQVVNKIGEGAFASVVLAEKSDQKYAIKIVPKKAFLQDEDYERFQREIDSLSALKHQNIAQLNDFFQDANNFYLVLDYCPGGELSVYMKRNGQIVEATAALLFQQITSAVAYCHACGVAHRDLKPANIMITKFPFLKVTDFGLCGYIQQDRLMTTFCGSPCYAAPECQLQQPYDGTLADVWSLGVILFEMVVGRPPWPVSNHAQMLQQIVAGEIHFPKEISPLLKDLLSKLLTRRPSERITVQQILHHPWLKIASQAKIVAREGITVLPPTVPEASTVRISEISRDLRRYGSKEIISPYANERLKLVNMPRSGSGVKITSPTGRTTRRYTASQSKSSTMQRQMSLSQIRTPTTGRTPPSVSFPF